MVFIRSASSISVQESFGKNEKLQFYPIDFPAKVKEPDYKDLPDPTLLRRMAPVVRYGVAAGIDCLKSAGINKPDAIIAGTGLGCLRDTEKFIQVISRASLAPTAFIQSTHNTIAAQISMQIKCHSYNSTFVQNGLSFENALLDGVLQLREGAANVLVGCADEKISLLDEIGGAFHLPQSEIDKISEGSAFFLLSPDNERAMAEIVDVKCFTTLRSSIDTAIRKFLLMHELSPAEIDCVLVSRNTFIGKNELLDNWQVKIDITKYCGIFHTNSGFALFMGAMLLQNKLKTSEELPKKLEKILIVNNYNDKSLGLILIQQP